MSSLVFMMADATAQTEPIIEIQAAQSDLEQEYRDELDKWMLRAYEGDRDAQFKVGVLFTNDQFGPPDFEQAVYWYKQAARQGHVLAQYNLGHQYLTGVGVEKSEEAAMRWWLEAAKQDHALAQFNVGRAYFLGIGLQEDHERSKYWFERAATNQEPKSIDLLKQLGWWDGQLALNSNSVGQPPSTNSLIASAGPVDATGRDVTRDVSEVASKIVPIQTQTREPTQVQPSPAEERPQASIQATPIAPAQAPVAQANPASSAPTPEEQNNQIALYTDPAIRSVLIAILDDRSTLTELDRRGEWVTVQNNTGFPVWVHGDFLTVSDDVGTLTGEAVNARSVPIITNGTVVGKLNKNESVEVLDQRKNWYRVVAPARFKAWVKVAELDRPLPVQPEPNTQVANQSSSQPSSSSAAPTGVIRQGTLGLINDNDWLFGQPTSHYTLQLASFDEQAKVEEFISRSKFVNNPELHRFTAEGKNIEWTYFLYGSYPSREAAEAAKQQISQSKAWVRTFGRLQQNRCVSWKTKLPTPRELNQYCTQ